MNVCSTARLCSQNSKAGFSTTKGLLCDIGGVDISSEDRYGEEKVNNADAGEGMTCLLSKPMSRDLRHLGKSIEIETGSHPGSNIEERLTEILFARFCVPEENIHINTRLPT